MQFVFGFLLAGLALIATSLQRTYASLPARELKYRARRGDVSAKQQYRAVAYGPSLRGFLWLVIGLSCAGFFTVLALSTPWWFALSGSALLLWLNFVWLPPKRATKLSSWFAVKCAPVLAWILVYLHPLFDKLHGFIRRHRPLPTHTGIYDRQDLKTLLEQQSKQVDNRIEKAELEIAGHALNFGELKIRQVMVPRRVVATVAAKDSTGPVLMSELHDSGHSRFPVHGDKQDDMVGTLYLRDLLDTKKDGKVSDVMRRDVFYVHEEQPLYDALQAILKTHHHLLIVVNSFEEYVGIITIEDVLEQVIGHPIMDEFDQYENLRMVAERFARSEHQEHQDSPTDKNSVK